jgi:Tfp pilus assembly protein PilO
MEFQMSDMGFLVLVAFLVVFIVYAMFFGEKKVEVSNWHNRMMAEQAAENRKRKLQEESRELEARRQELAKYRARQEQLQKESDARVKAIIDSMQPAPLPSWWCCSNAFEFSDEEVNDMIARKTKIDIKYVDMNGEITERTIRIHSHTTYKIRAYCWKRRAMREFDKSNITYFGIHD